MVIDLQLGRANRIVYYVDKPDDLPRRIPGWELNMRSDKPIDHARDTDTPEFLFIPARQC